MTNNIMRFIGDLNLSLTITDSVWKEIILKL